MLPEILLYATAHTSPEMRRLGLVGDAVALWSRARRCRRAWTLHERRCEAEIEASIADLPRRRTALVLGSGLLRDIAYDALLGGFERLILVDAVHLWPARARMRGRPVTRIVADLTGGAGRARDDTGATHDPLAGFHADPDLDFVLSANVLSQLPMAVARWREGRRIDAPDAAGRIVREHLAGLLRFRARACLLTDIRHRALDRAGTLLRETDLLHGTVLPAPDAAWDWEVAPFGEVDRRERHVHRVQAYRDLARACAHDGAREAS